MGRFSQIKKLQCKIKTEAVEKILSNQNLLKYVYYPSSNPLNEPDIENTSSLINTYIFKRGKTLNTEDHTQNFIFVRISSPTNGSGSLYKDIYVIFDIICHNTLIDNLNDGSDRSLCILDELDEMFDCSTSQYWGGNMQYQNFRELMVNESFSGYRLTYKVVI